MEGWSLRCGSCGHRLDVLSLAWRCPACAGLLDLDGPVGDPTPPAGAPWSLWRYAGALPPLAPVTLGEGMTPLVASATDPTVLWKLDFVMPTLSFKDRGAALVMAGVAAAGARSVIADSSGNAGTSVAAYAARAGVAARVFVPGATSPAKVATIERLGATVEVIAGDRAATAEAARHAVEAAGPGVVYASHVHQPLFTAGTATFAYEVWEQLGGRLPGTVVLPAGNGTLVLGAAAGFARLVAAGLAPAAPAIVTVQAAACAPIAGRRPTGPTVAEGIAITDPPRAAQVRAATRTFLLAEERQIFPARADLARRGVDVELTAAATWAAWRAWPGAAAAARPVVVALCGAGLKAPGPAVTGVR
ncbi:MAG TPA: pyridoxal-phosphate dependent enzyme [Acidimicrobiales bacterium]|nr:pyridoxal-phosphate dependent enzyme [Acidimicrobiales bacterium]